MARTPTSAAVGCGISVDGVAWDNDSKKHDDCTASTRRSNVSCGLNEHKTKMRNV